jgi:cytochrome c5
MRWLACLALLALFACACFESNPNAARDSAESLAKAAYPAVPDVNEIPALRTTGQRMFGASSCEMCHSTTRERKGLAGPPLGGISGRVLERFKGDPLESRRWLVKHIRDPHAFPSPFAGSEDYRNAAMPPNGRLREKDMQALVEYLWSLP